MAISRNNGSAARSIGLVPPKETPRERTERIAASRMSALLHDSDAPVKCLFNSLGVPQCDR
jgi:hypothetical protein